MKAYKLLPVILVIGTLLLASIAPLASSMATAQAQKTIVLRTHGWWQPPPARRFNPFAPKAIRITGLVTERLAQWIKLTNTFSPELAIGWKVDRANNRVIVYLRKGVYWHDGTPFTCKDVWTTLMLYKVFNRPVWNYISDVKCLDKYTVEYDVKKWSYLLLWYILYFDGEIVAPYHIYGKFAEEAAKATTKAELNKIREEVLKFEPKTIIGTGPFKFVAITPSEVILEKFPKFWAADKVHIDKIVMPYIVSNQVGWQYYLTGRLDYDCFMMPPSVLKQVESKPFAMVVKIYDLSGFALVFNFNNKWLRNLDVRRAIAYAINRTRVAIAAGAGLFDPVVYPTGLLKVMEKPWIEDLITSGVLMKYEYNPAKAAELMKKAGFTKKNGVWYTPDGKPFTLTLIAPGGWTDWMAAANEIAQELKSFGIQVKLLTPDAPSYWSDRWYLGGHFDLAIDFYGVWMTYPWKTFHRIFIEVNNHPRSQVQGPAFTEFFNHVYLPYFKTTINASRLVNILAVTFDKATQKKVTEELAYTVNYYLPEYPIAEKRLVLYANTQHFIWPDPKLNYVLWQNAAGGHLEALAFMIRLGAVVPNPSYWGVSVPMPPKKIPIPQPMTPTTTTMTQTMAKTMTTTQTVTVTKASTQTVTVTKTAYKTVTKTTGGGYGAGWLAAAFIIGIIIGLIIGYAASRRK